MMRKVILACVMAASLAGCSWMHRDRNTESSGSTTPPAAQAQSQPSNSEAMSGTSANNANPDWSNCEDHPYTPGPKTCK